MNLILTKKKEKKMLSIILFIFLCIKEKIVLNSKKKSSGPILTNSISTSKYTIYNVIPKILFEQFSKISNIYFLIIAFLEIFKDISNSNGKPIILFPLLIVVTVNGIKDFYEDWKRKKKR